MSEKLNSEILRIDLSDASYKDSSAYIVPTYVNFFFGNNGAGKSTIAKAIQSGSGITYVAGKNAKDYLPLVYNQEFIDENFHNYENMPGVFTLNKMNYFIQGTIKEITDACNLLKSTIQKSTECISETNSEISKLDQDFLDTCWNREKPLRERFFLIQTNTTRKKLFADAIQNAVPRDIDLEKLNRLYDSAYSTTSKSYSLFSIISNTAIMDTLKGIEILSVSIVNSADTGLANFLKEMGATEWARQGHDSYSKNAGCKCPYCSQNLPEDFETIFLNSFDDSYQINLNKLLEFLVSYEESANRLLPRLQNIPSELYPQIDIRPYNDKLSALKGVLQSNIETIRKKVAAPATTVHLEKTAPILDELSALIDNYNNLITENNTVVADRAAKQNECTSKLFSLMAFHLKDVIHSYNKRRLELKTELELKTSLLEEEKLKLSEAQAELSESRKSMVETDTAKDRINQMLHDSGMQGFSLEKKQGMEHVYEVIRPDGSIATNLSEGEKNFIAFLYFFYLVQGSTSAEGDTREKIVVIDDPVSSMDSGSLFIVSTLVRQLIEICRNNADNRNSATQDNFIKQIFILTHNAYFHRAVAYRYLPKYEYVSFYLIRKRNSRSMIKLCDAVNPNEPTARINVNPVKNSYAALWEEYRCLKELKVPSPSIPLMNVIRRILEYYFLQLCGYEDSQLRQIILIDGKANGNFKDENGNDDDEKYQLASAMLSYMNSSSLGINDGLDFVDEYLDADECCSIFEMIFDLMNQKQHYDMMLNIQ